MLRREIKPLKIVLTISLSRNKTQGLLSKLLVGFLLQII